MSAKFSDGLVDTVAHGVFSFGLLMVICEADHGKNHELRRFSSFF